MIALLMSLVVHVIILILFLYAAVLGTILTLVVIDFFLLVYIDRHHNSLYSAVQQVLIH